MIWCETALPGVWLLKPERRSDERGSFARCWCADEAAERGIVARWVQTNSSVNLKAGTLRGLHLQRVTHPEPKLVRCVRGAVFDVAVDLRDGSSTFGRWVGVELSAANGDALYLPTGIAHGFQTLADDAEVFYLMGGRFAPQAQTGVRWDDSEIGVHWPTTERVISERDASLPFLSEWRRAA